MAADPAVWLALSTIASRSTSTGWPSGSGIVFIALVIFLVFALTAGAFATGRTCGTSWSRSR